MLIRLTVENWISFKESATFSMVATGEQQFSNRLPGLDKYRLELLPVAALYGGNASGKSNFIHALRFIQNMVVRGTHTDDAIAVEPFRLDGESFGKPSQFLMVIVIDDAIYEFSFSCNDQIVIEEKLVEISVSSEKVLYHRQEGKPHFHSSLEKDQFLAFAFQGTRDNQLFLTNSVSQKVERFRPVYDWFGSTLRIILPDQRFFSKYDFIDKENLFNTYFNNMLHNLDTGIHSLAGESIQWDHAPLPSDLKTEIKSTLKDGKSVNIFNLTGERYVAKKEKGELTAKKLVTYHLSSDGKEVKFELRQESDGTLRLLDLLPVFLDISQQNSKRVYIIDEIDRSLHTLLTRKLLEGYLENCNKHSRTQIIFTTHDVLLMDQSLLRWDEMWVTERDATGNSTLLSFSEYKEVRNDKDIRKSYLQGRLGGIPRFLLSCAPAPLSKEEGEE